MRTDQRIKDALIAVMKDKSFDKVIVANICEVAGISRPTFYAHFSDKFDVVNRIFDDLFDRTVLNYRESHTWDGTISLFLEELQNERTFYINAYSYRGQNCLFEHHTNRVYSFYFDMIEGIKNAYMSEAELVSLRIYVNGAMTLIDQWISSGFTTSIQELEHYFKSSMPENIKQYLVF